MKSAFRLFLLSVFAASASALAEDRPVAFHARLIRGTDQPNLQEAAWKPIGPNLSKQLCPVFRWKYYWEVNRQPLAVQRGKTARAKLSNDRTVEVEMPTAEDLEIRLYHQGKLIRKTRQPVQCKQAIMGGTRENDECWFVVVRREKPAEPKEISRQ